MITDTGSFGPDRLGSGCTFSNRTTVGYFFVWVRFLSSLTGPLLAISSLSATSTERHHAFGFYFTILHLVHGVWCHERADDTQSHQSIVTANINALRK
jgi:hypothetical protein